MELRFVQRCHFAKVNGWGGGVGRFYKVGVYVRFKKKIKWELCGLNTICVIIHNKIVVQFLITEHIILRMVLYT